MKVEVPPGQSQPARLWTKPYYEVAKAFRGFKGNTLNRGGCPVHRLPFFNPNNAPGWFTYNKNYHVESSFSDEQRPYVTATLACLTAMAQGRVIESDEELPLFSRRVEDVMIRDGGSFCNAFVGSFLDLLEEFGWRYSNLMPATSALFEVAGTEGFALAASKAATYYALASHGLSSNEIEEHVQRDARREHFVLTHPLYPGRPKDYEIWCSGEALAKELMRQGKEAALNLAAGGMRNPIVDIDLSANRLSVKRLVEKLSAFAETQNAA